MSVLLDSCTLLWLANDPRELSVVATEAIRSANIVAVSPMSIFEIARKFHAGKLSLLLSPLDWYEEAIRTHGLTEVGITGPIAARAAVLPMIHRDPADRFLIATALEKGMRLITPDPEIWKYPEVRVVW